MDNIIKVTILCTSDIHGYFMPWNYSNDKESSIGGLTRISTIYEEIKQSNPNTMIIDNGDLIQGNNAEVFINEEKNPAILALNKIGYELYNMGNHEFNFGMEALDKTILQFNGIAMMGNLYKKKDSMRYMNGIYYKNIGNIRIGFIGLNTPMVRRFEEKRGHLKNYDVTNPEFELKNILNQMEDCDAIIGVFHMGDINENDIPNTGVIDLIKNVDGAEKLNAVFGGHMHQVKNYKINDTIFLEPGVHGEALSRIDLVFDTSKSTKKLIDIKGSIIKVDDTIKSDKELETILSESHEKLRKLVNEFAGYTTKDLTEKDEINGIPQLWVSQTKLSEFYCDVMLKYSKADIVAVHFDNPYPEILKGEIKRKDINSSYPYSGGEISNFYLTGNQILKYMEWCAAYFNKSKPGDVNISFDPKRTEYKYSTYDIFGNIKYTIDLNKEKGNRIVNPRFSDGTKLDLEKTYVIGMNKYRMDHLIAKNGPLAGEKIEPFYSTLTDKSLGVRGTIRNLAIKYLNELPNKTYIPKENLRWKIIKNNNYKEYREIAIKLINEGSLLLYKNELGKNDLTKSLNIFDELNEEQLVVLRKNYKFSREIKILKEIIDEIRSKYEI